MYIYIYYRLRSNVDVKRELNNYILKRVCIYPLRHQVFLERTREYYTSINKIYRTMVGVCRRG
jgi:hypothetical protein